MVALLPFLLVFVIITCRTSEALLSIHPSVITREPGQTFSLWCNSQSPNATVQWTLPNQVDNITGRLLLMENASANDSGVYECSVNGESATANVFIFTGKVAVFTMMQSGVQFIKLPPGSILTSVTPSQQFICVTALPGPPQWYYNDSLLPANMSNDANKTNNFTNLNTTGNYTCTVDKSNNYTVTLTAEHYYIEMLKDNITGTLGGQVCAYWRAGLSYTNDDRPIQYDEESVAENTMVLLMDDLVGESSLESAEILIVAPYLFSYCENYAENENYKIAFGEPANIIISFTFTLEVPTLSTSGSTSLLYGEGGNIVITCYSDLPLESIVWRYHGNHTDSSLCKLMTNGCTGDSLFARSTHKTSGNGTVHQLLLPVEDALHGVYSCGIYPMMGSNVVEPQNFTFYECPFSIRYGLLWESVVGNTTVDVPCSSMHSLFRESLYITRKCSINGTWMAADLSSCAVGDSDFASLMILSFLCPASVVNVTIEMKVEEALNTLNLSYESVNTITYPLESNSVFIVGIKSFHNVSYTTDNIHLLHSSTASSSATGCNMSDNTSTALYVLNDVCYCHSMENKTTIFHQFCVGPSLPACICVTTSSCKCSKPFVGDGRQCTIDSDGDGFGDNELDCELDICRRDNCPFNRNQNNQDCDDQLVSSSGCPLETDPYWNITWKPTLAGMTDTQKCPSGTIGNATRLCTINNKWSDQINILDCERIEFVELSNLVNLGKELAELNESTTENIRIFNDVLSGLIEITDTESSLLPEELSTTSQLLDTAIVYANVLNSTQQSKYSSKVIEIANNLLDVSNVPGYAELNNAVNSTLHNISSLLISLENYGLLLEPTVLSKSNIMLSVQDLLLNTSATELTLSLHRIITSLHSVNSPAVVKIPKEALTDKSNETMIRVVSIVYNNLEEFLPKTSQQKSGIKELGTKVIAIRVSDNVTFSKQASVTLLFKLLPGAEVHGNIDCVFWDIKNSMWSSQGLTYVRHNDSHVECRSEHLTAFSVLVDVHGTSARASNSLSYVTFIGCGISLLCLVIAVLLILLFRKVLLVDLLGHAHINICVALFGVLVTFLSGIETARKNEISCVLVASLIHYFLLVMFCWMLCEGVILYSLTSGAELKKKSYMFYLFAWGIPWLIVIPAVAVKQSNYTQENICWLSRSHNTIWAFVGPVAFIICVNSLLLVIILIKVYHSIRFANKNGRASKEDKKRLHTIKVMTRNILLLLPVMGCTWLFGLLSINEVSLVFIWIFCILNSLQGLLILILHVIANPKLQGHIKAKFEHRRRIKAVTDSFKSSSTDKRYYSQSTATTLANNINGNKI